MVLLIWRILILSLCLQVIFQQKIVDHRELEYNRLKKEKEDRINQIVAARKHEREMKRKMLFYLKSEEERLTRLREEEEARKREGKYCAPNHIMRYKHCFYLHAMILWKFLRILMD